MLHADANEEPKIIVARQNPDIVSGNARGHNLDKVYKYNWIYSRFLAPVNLAVQVSRVEQLEDLQRLNDQFSSRLYRELEVCVGNGFRRFLVTNTKSRSIMGNSRLLRRRTGDIPEFTNGGCTAPAVEYGRKDCAVGPHGLRGGVPQNFWGGAPEEFRAKEPTGSKMIEAGSDPVSRIVAPNRQTDIISACSECNDYGVVSYNPTTADNYQHERFD